MRGRPARDPERRLAQISPPASLPRRFAASSQVASRSLPSHEITLLVGRLARLFRYSLEGSERHVVPLGDEISNVTEYLEVERVRFRERLRYAVLVDPALHSIEVPPMLLQPLVENAVKHGASRRVEGGSVTLRAELAGDDLLLFVLDDGPGPEGSSHRGTGTSLLDLRERLRLLYGEDGRLSAGVGPEGGFMARLRLPARWNR
ncbi:sensor histidine kinase [Sorangium sp. So ce1151]|uniref:sensor histidine kinase n=1 Tax=Sorangium sp. So ce1151 TaxID=3133332 RepID=UPI003F63ECE1